MESINTNIPTQKFDQAMGSEPTKAEVLEHITCSLCKGVYRNPHTFSECMCTFCKCCIQKYFDE